MSRQCQICSLPKEIQNRMAELKKQGQSLQNIQNIIESETRLKIDDSAIGRHLKNHVGKEAGNSQEIIEMELQGIEDEPPENTIVHTALCNVLFNSIKIFNKRINETASMEVSYDVHIDAVKALDVLVNTFEKLYQNPKEGVTHQELPKLSDLQVKLALEIEKEPEMDDEALTKKIESVIEEHQNLKNNGLEHQQEE